MIRPDSANLFSAIAPNRHSSPPRSLNSGFSSRDLLVTALDATGRLTSRAAEARDISKGEVTQPACAANWHIEEVEFADERTIVTTTHHLHRVTKHMRPRDILRAKMWQQLGWIDRLRQLCRNLSAQNLAIGHGLATKVRKFTFR